MRQIGFARCDAVDTSLTRGLLVTTVAPLTCSANDSWKGMFKSILVVCIGNICRSPTGEALLKSKLAGRGISVSSAGLGALVGKPVDATATQVMAAAGYTLPEHQARQLTADMLREADLILAMELKHLQSIHSMAPHARGKTFLFGKWSDNREVPDPYRQQLPAFEHVFKILDESATAWLPYLK